MTHAYQTEKTLSALFFKQAEKFSDDLFLFGKFEKGAATQKWIGMSWGKASDQVRKIGAGLIELGLNKGDRAAIFSHNRPRWVIADQAIQAAGGWGVPIYPTSTDDQLAYILNDCRAKVVFAGDEELVRQVLRVKPNTPALKYIICMTPMIPMADASLINFDDLGERGVNSDKATAEMESRRASLCAEDVAAIIYTSGTTGEPKGAVLTQSNFMSDVGMMLDATVTNKMMERGIRLCSLCHLPLCHIYGRTSDYHVQIAMAGQMWFAESYQKVPQNLMEVRPQMLITIPRLYEKVYEMVNVQSAKMSGVRKKVFDWSLRVGNQVVDHLSSGKKLPPILSLKFGLAAGLVFDRVRKAAGLDRLVFAGSGGGALSAETNRFFRAMNIQLVEGYGLTETTSAITWNSLEFLKPMPDKWIYRKALDYLIDTMVVMQSQGKSAFAHPIGMFKLSLASNLVLPQMIQKPGTVGRACKDTEIKIADDGEILARGPQVFHRDKGYHNRPDWTAEAFTEDGFFKTGDHTKYAQLIRVFHLGLKSERDATG